MKTRVTFGDSILQSKDLEIPTLLFFPFEFFNTNHPLYFLVNLGKIDTPLYKFNYINLVFLNLIIYNSN